jgi:hypothetical protein
MSALRRAVMDAIDSSESRCRYFYNDDENPEPCDGLDGCERCLRLAADAVLRVIEPMIRKDEIARVMDADTASANMGRTE